MKRVMALAAMLVLAACGGSDEQAEADAMTYEAETLAAEGGNDLAKDTGTSSGLMLPDEVVAGETYSEFDERRDELEGEAGSYAGYGCTVDCSGHEAGYNWAADNDITDPNDCGGNSWSFIEGCEAYAEENGGY